MMTLKHYIVCVNQRQARKDAADRQAIIESLEDQLKKGPKSLVGNKGYRRYLKVEKAAPDQGRTPVRMDRHQGGFPRF